MKIDKLQASGNDFIIIENIEHNNLLRKEIALKVCDRHFGVGSDGIVFLNRRNENTFDFRIWNNNGTEAEISGNGLINAGAFVALTYKKEIKDTVIFTIISLIAFPLLFIPFLNFVVQIALWMWLTKDTLQYDSASLAFQNVEVYKLKTHRIAIWFISFVTVLFNFIPIFNIFAPFFGEISMFHYWKKIQKEV